MRIGHECRGKRTMTDEELAASAELEENSKEAEGDKVMFQPDSKPLLYFGYFVLVLLLFSTIFSLIKVVAE